MDIKVRSDEKAAISPAQALIHEGMSELHHNGVAPIRGPVGVEHTDRVIYALDQDEIIGVVTYRLLEAVDIYEISLAYVEPSSRRMGVCRAMLNELKRHAKAEAVKRIVSVAHINNKSMQAALHKLGSKPVSLMFALDI